MNVALPIILEKFYESFNELKDLYKLELNEQKADKKQFKELEQTLKLANKINLVNADGIKDEAITEQNKIIERIASREKTLVKYKKILRKFKDIDNFINENF